MRIGFVETFISWSDRKKTVCLRRNGTGGAWVQEDRSFKGLMEPTRTTSLNLTLSPGDRSLPDYMWIRDLVETRFYR